MKYRLQDLIDIEQLQSLQNRLNEIYSFPSAIIDNDGTILTATAWQDICTNFHRRNPESERECIKSDQYILNHLAEANPAVSYRCPHGLVDNATPIIINGEHLGNFFTGQFFLEKPDLEFFRKQAETYGFDEEAYLAAVRKVPVWTQEQLNNYLYFIKGLIEVIANIGLKNLKEIEASEKIRASEERRRTIFRTAMDGIWQTDQQGRLLEVNEAYCRMSGYSEQELLTMKISDLEAAESPADTAARMQRIMAQGEDRFETLHRRKDGSVFNVEISVQYKPNDGGFFFAFLKDITERKHAEESLKTSESRYRSLVENLGLGVSLIDREHKIIMVNNHHAQMYDKPVEYFIGKYCHEVFEKRSAVCPHCPGTAAMTTGRAAEVITAGIRDDGHKFDAKVQAFPVYEGDTIKGFIEVVENITEKKKADDARIRLSTAVEQASEMIIVMDAQGIIEYANPMAEKITGFKKLELTGKSPFLPSRGIYKKDFFKTVWETITSGATWTGRVTETRKDGSSYEIVQTITPVQDSSGKITSFVAIGRDITNEVKLEEQLRQSQKMEAIGTLAGGIAHDFNNILGAIIGFTEAALDYVPEGIPARNYLKQTIQSADRAAELVMQILSFSRKSLPERQPVIIHLIVKEVVKLLRASIPATVEIRPSINEAAGSVMSDPTQIHQILMNLCTNAAHAMEGKGGILAIGLSWLTIVQEDSKRYPDIQPGPYIKLTVSDTGMGIDPSISNRIFDPFFTTKEKGKGTGMGLAVVHGIVKSHGGAITVESQPGKGSTFTVLLPRISHDQRAQQASVEKRPVARGTESLLLVDDELFLLQSGKTMLESLGYKVTALQSSKEALALFEQNPAAFDLVITDQTMPGMTGYELAQHLMHIRKNIAVILCTGYSEAVSEEQARGIGIKGFILKPVRKKDIAEMIRQILDKK